MRSTTLSDIPLCKAVREMEQGLIDADLGGGLVKKRVALSGRGKSGGARTLIATNKSDRWFFVFGFEKNEMDNIGGTELKALKEYAPYLLGLNTTELTQYLGDSSLTEICHE